MADAQARTALDAHEADTPSLRGIAIGAGVIVAAVAVAIGAAFALVIMGPHGMPPSAPAAPALQASPQADIEAYRQEKAALLAGYGWVDRAHGIVRMPIEQAMATLASRQPQRAHAR